MYLLYIMYSSRNYNRYPATNYDPGHLNPYYNNPWCGPWCGPGYERLPYYAYPNYYSPNPYPY